MTPALNRLDDEINRLFSHAQENRLIELTNNRLKETIQFLSGICNRYIPNPRPSIGDIFIFHPEVREACVAYARNVTISSPREALQFFEELYPSMYDRWIQQCRTQLIEILHTAGGEEVTFYFHSP